MVELKMATGYLPRSKWRGTVYFLSAWIWAGPVTHYDQKNAGKWYWITSKIFPCLKHSSLEPGVILWGNQAQANGKRPKLNFQSTAAQTSNHVNKLPKMLQPSRASRWLQPQPTEQKQHPQ